MIKLDFFLMKLCFKFANLTHDKDFLTLNLEQALNIAQLEDRRSNLKKRQWQSIERFLLIGKSEKIDLIDFVWNFDFEHLYSNRLDSLPVDETGNIKIELKNDGCLKDIYYKYITSVTIYRTYDLNDIQLTLPFKTNFEDQKPTKPQPKIVL